MVASLITPDGRRLPLPRPIQDTIRACENRLYCADESPVAAYEKGHWRSGGEAIESVLIESPVYIQFREGAESSETFGPFQPVKITDSLILVGTDEAAFAQLTQSERSWVEIPAKRAWQEIAMTAARA